MASQTNQLPATQRGAATRCYQAVPCSHQWCCGVGCCAVHVCCGVWSAHADGLGVAAGSVEASLHAAGASIVWLILVKSSCTTLRGCSLLLVKQSSHGDTAVWKMLVCVNTAQHRN